MHTIARSLRQSRVHGRAAAKHHVVGDTELEYLVDPLDELIAIRFQHAGLWEITGTGMRLAY